MMRMFRLCGLEVARLDVVTSFVQKCHVRFLRDVTPTSSSATTDLRQYTLVAKARYGLSVCPGGPDRRIDWA